MRAKDLKEGVVFRQAGQRKWRSASLIVKLPSRLTDDGKTGMLVCLADCQQIVLSNDDKIEMPGSQEDIDRDGFIKLGRLRHPDRLRVDQFA